MRNTSPVSVPTGFSSDFLTIILTLSKFKMSLQSRLEKRRAKGVLEVTGLEYTVSIPRRKISSVIFFPSVI